MVWYSVEMTTSDDNTRAATYQTLANQSLPQFNISGLDPAATYTIRVCTSNQQFWQDIDCTATFEATTLNGRSG